MTRERNNIIKFPGETIADIEAAAATWLARMTSGSMTLAELAEFGYWRAASPERDRCWREMETMWGRLGAGSAAQAFASQKRSPPIQPRRISPRGLGRLGWVGRLAAWLRDAAGSTARIGRMGQFAAAIVTVLLTFQYLSAWRYDYHTGPGEIRRIALADGSTVQLKGNAALNVRLATKGARTVELVRGEAFFDVRHDAARPFTVLVGSGEVRDIGTAFLVSRNGESAAVTVEQGVVAVAAGGLSQVLQAGDQVSFNQYDLTRQPHVQTDAIAPWRRRLYVAENKPLGAALSDLNEYVQGRIVVTSRSLAARRVNAVVQLDHVDDWFDALNDTRNVSVRRLGPFIFVSAREG